MSEIGDFLRTRILERRALAVAARHGGEGRWHRDDPERFPGRVEDERGDPVVYDEGSPSDEQSAHIVANDPAAVIADCDAKLSLVDLLTLTESWSGYHTGRAALHALAQPFAGRHPDHRGEEWAP